MGSTLCENFERLLRENDWTHSDVETERRVGTARSRFSPDWGTPLRVNFPQVHTKYIASESMVSFVATEGQTGPWGEFDGLPPWDTGKVVTKLLTL